MTAKIYLKTVEHRDDDKVIVMGSDKEPALFTGDNPDESLACGGCKRVLAKHVSIRSLYEGFNLDARIVMLCPCGTYSLIKDKQTE